MKRILAIFTSMRDAYFATGATDYDFNNWVTVVKGINPLFTEFLNNIDFNTKDSFVQIRYNGYCIYHRNLKPRNSIYRECRSHIIDLQTMQFVATPFPKFFNYNEIPAENLTEADNLTIMEKLDGSMVILTQHNGQTVVATSKSMVAEKNNRISKILHLLESTHTNWKTLIDDLGVECTILAELVGYDNAHVVQYAEELELRLIGIRHKDDGSMLRPKAIDFVGRVYHIKTAQMVKATLEELLSQREQSKDNIEGWVCISADGRMMKVKTLHYMSMHTVLLGRGHANKIVEYIANDTVDDLLGSLTDEARGYIVPLIDEVIDNAVIVQDRAMQIANELRHLSKAVQYSAIKQMDFIIQPFVRQALYHGKVEYLLRARNGKLLTFKELQDIVAAIQEKGE